MILDKHGKFQNFDFLNKKLKDLPRRINYMSCMAYDQESNIFCFGVNNGDVAAISGETFEKIKEFKAHQSYVTSIDCCNKSSLIATTSNDLMIYLWDIRKYTLTNKIYINEISYGIKIFNYRVFSIKNTNNIQIFNNLDSKFTQLKGFHYDRNLAENVEQKLLGFYKDSIIIYESNRKLSIHSTPYTNRVICMSFANSFLFCGTLNGKILKFGIDKVTFIEEKYLGSYPILFLCLSDDLKFIVYSNQNMSYYCEYPDISVINKYKTRIVTGTFFDLDFIFIDYKYRACVCKKGQEMINIQQDFLCFHYIFSFKKEIVILRSEDQRFLIYSRMNDKMVRMFKSKKEVKNYLRSNKILMSTNSLIFLE